MSNNNPNSRKPDFVTRRGRRLVFFGVMVTFMLGGLLLRVFQLKRDHGKEYESAAVQQLTQNANTGDQEKNPNRGHILDRNKNTLAVSNKVYNVQLDVTMLDARARNLEEPEKDMRNRVFTALNEILGIPLEKLEALFAKNAAGELINPTYYEIVAWGIPTTDAIKIQELKLRDVYLIEDTERKYIDPYLAPQTIGFQRGDAFWGLEGYYNQELIGEQGRVLRTYDEDNNPVVEETAARNGYTLITTLDAGIQRIAQQIAEDAFQKIECEYSGVLIADPDTMEIIAMAQTSSFSLDDPDDPEFYTDKRINSMWEALTVEQQLEQKYKVWGNYNVTRTFEPGSIFKPVVVAAALEENTVDPATASFFCGGKRWVADWEAPCWYLSGHGSQTLTEVLANSCNLGMIDIMNTLGRDKFFKYRNDFGFGETTGIDFPGEASASSLMIPLSTLNPVELGTSAMGQGFNNTAIQAVTAFSAVINGGNFMKPYLVSQIVDENGNVVKENTPQVVRKVISEETSDFMRYALQKIVSPEGTGKGAIIDGYTIGGKTGSAQQDVDRQGMTLSFMGFTPVEDPQYIALVVLDHVTDKELTSGASVSPMMRELLWQIIQDKNIPPSDESAGTNTVLDIETDRSILAEYSGMQLVDVTHSLNTLEIDYTVSGIGTVVKNHIPPSGTAVPKDRPVHLYMDPETARPEEMTYVPDVSGMEMKEAEEHIMMAHLTPVTFVDKSESAGTGGDEGGPATYYLTPPVSEEGEASGEEPVEEVLTVYEQYPAAAVPVPPGVEVKLKVR
ncbi:MAG: hypothetical protein LBR83_01690 [Clostridiales bacterium]|jgi:stage V sporulation protein D (sporulation-specific penicillin-binding protein)|nr:hypothetical protein [Clostridiales bacterium]